MNQEYMNVVAKGDLVRIRSHITSEIMSDPTFSTKKVQQYIDYALSHGIKLFEPYAKTPCEMPVPENEEQWDRRLFYGKIEDLRLNFAYNERFELIRKIGQKVYRDDSFTEAPKDHRSKTKNKVVPLVVWAALLVALAMVIYLVIK